jgi:hypothetical protein
MLRAELTSLAIEARAANVQTSFAYFLIRLFCLHSNQVVLLTFQSGCFAYFLIRLFCLLSNQVVNLKKDNKRLGAELTSLSSEARAANQARDDLMASQTVRALLKYRKMCEG